MKNKSDETGSSRFKIRKMTCAMAIAISISSMLPGFSQNGRVGIGTTVPRAGLDVNHDDGIISTGEFNQGSVFQLPIEPVSKFFWIPQRAAFRVGLVTDDRWEPSKIGIFSVAMGRNNMSTGVGSLSAGDHNSAVGYASVALGIYSQSLGDYSFCMGQESIASAQGSVALGVKSNATGMVSMAFGHNVISSGEFSSCIGSYSTASGNRSVAIGTSVSTSGRTGAFAFGDGSLVPSPMEVSANNKFTARFANGYLLYTSADLSSFVAVGTGGNAWISSSDSTKKTNFVQSDGEDFLGKLRGMRLGSWNYRKQNAATMRHYGPMAQEFFSAFGKDAVGTIGNDTTLNAADVDGVAFVLLQALEKRTAQLQNENSGLKKQLADLRAATDLLSARLDAMQAPELHSLVRRATPSPLPQAQGPTRAAGHNLQSRSNGVRSGKGKTAE